MSDFYDHPGMLERYRAATAGGSDPKDVMEESALLEEIGDARGAPAGRIVFSTVHPVMTSHDPREHPDALMTDWVVDGYFDTGPREQRWLGETVVWHHRTVEDHLAALRGAGFELTALRECPPRRERFGGDEAEYRRRRRIPGFLLPAGRVP